MKHRILLVSSDKLLIEAVAGAGKARGAELTRVASAQETRSQWKRDGPPLTGVIADSLSLRAKERRQLLDMHRPENTPPLIFLDPPQSTYPTKDGHPIVRLQWPLAPSFLDLVPEIGTAPLLFLADPTLYLTGLLHEHLKENGLSTVLVDDTIGLAETLRRGPTQAYIGRWSGDCYAAEDAAHTAHLASANARVFLVESRGTIHAAESAMNRSRPAFLPRRLYETALDLIAGKPTVDPMTFGRVLLVDAFKPSLVELSASLMEDGYEVAACLDPQDAANRASTDSFQIAVVGSSFGSESQTGIELAHKLREIDEGMRLILMVERYPLKDALRDISEVVEVGLDDCLLKPIEPSRLKFSMSRALERRRLLLENTRLIRELRATNQELEQRSGFQKKFFAMVAHDVKNPLTAVQGYAEMLTMKLKSETQLIQAQRIKSASMTLAGLISDLVDFAAIESGKLRVNKTETDLLRVVREVGARVEVAAGKRKIKLIVSLPESLEEMDADPLRIGQVIENLCTNAIQYTPEGGSVTLQVEPRTGSVLISVRDTGIGISKADLPRIFQRFFQAANAQKLRKAGFGLGLKIAQEIVRAHNGGMGVDSELGKGSVFYFTLPRPQPLAPLS